MQSSTSPSSSGRKIRLKQKSNPKAKRIYKNNRIMEPSSTTEAAKLHIEEIRSRKFSIGKKDPNPLTQDLHHAVTNLSAELYTKDVHFLMELIQNAEDNEYEEGISPTLEFVLTTKDITGSGATATLLVFNNEIGFSKKNMDSICSVGRSTKKGQRQLGFIGEKGIGFKSVFLVSKQPHIFSSGYEIKFSEAPNQDCGIGFIVPEWVGEKFIVSNIHEIYGSSKVLPTTTIILPLRPEKVEAVKAQLSELHPEILLFLNKIKRLSVRGNSNDPKEADNVSAISICSETNHVAFRAKRADSRVVHLSAKEKGDGTEEMCRYYIWRQAFPVKPESKVSARKNVEECVISLAFPFGDRLKRGTSSVGIFAFLPTAMVTNFPFVIQADFILASSRETILLDNKWNLGILECVPSAFFSAFCSCVKEVSPLSSMAQAFEFLPAQTSSFPELNSIRESIKNLLQEEEIVPCEMFSEKMYYRKPRNATRVLPKFRELLLQIKEHGVPLEGLFSLGKSILHSSLDLERYSGILKYLGVVSVDDSYDWYGKCIEACNFVLPASEDAYVELLCFVADNEKFCSFNKFKSIPFLKYINRDGEVELCAASKTSWGMHKIVYALGAELHAWLSKCNGEFGCPNSTFFLPNSTQKALLSHKRSSFLCTWLSSYAGVNSCSTYAYGLELCHYLNVRMESKLAIKFAHFLYHSYSEEFMNESSLCNLCQKMPIVDGSRCIRIHRTVTLVSASGSKWVKLFGPINPFSEQNYIDIGELYSESYQFAGRCTPEKVLLGFLIKHAKAHDLPELLPPNMALPVASSVLTREQAFLLLDWIRFLRARGSIIPEKFMKSIRDGRWMRTYSGFNCPTKSILLDETEKIIFETMKNVLCRFSVLDQKFYTNRISAYADELKLFGVQCGSDDVQKLLGTCFTSLASSGMSKESTFSLLMFISILKATNRLDKQWLESIKKGNWLRTSQGFNAPKGSVFLQPETEAKALSKITNLSVIDEMFYGSKIATFSSELLLLDVVLDLGKVYNLMAENLNFPINMSSITGDCGLLILKCIRYLASTSSGFLEKIMNQPWLKTSLGIKCPSGSVLPEIEWACMLMVVEVPIVDEAFYGNEIRSFMTELKSVGVAVDIDSALKLIVAKFKLLSSSSCLTPANVILLLDCFRELNRTMPSQSLELGSSLLGVKWLKTRHGYKTPGESILFSSKWATISLFVDLPLIDDSFYSIGIYGYKDELKMMGVVTDFNEGAPLVARGLKKPIEPTFITKEGTIALLECIKFLVSESQDQLIYDDFLNNLKRSKWLKTIGGYENPEKCILFDAAWKCIIMKTDAPTIDEKFYETDISLYKNQLRAIGVKVDPGDVCLLLSSLLMSYKETPSIMRIYNFLNKFQFQPQSPDEYNSFVWIPNQNGGKWINSQLCVLHDKDNLFGYRLQSLDKHYKKDLLPMFSSAFGVAGSPSIDDYLKLWDDWILSGKHQVTAVECCSFWRYIIGNWNPDMDVTLRQKLSKLPATTSAGDDIHLVSKEVVFLPDDLQLKKMFTSVDRVPLFVWFPKSCSSYYVYPRRLYDIYCSLGVRKISESVECNVGSILPSDQSEQSDSSNGLIEKGLIKIILGFLAGPQVNMPVKDRHGATKSLLDVSVFVNDKPIQVSYRLKVSADTTLEVETKKMVLWEKALQRLLIDRSGYENRKTSIEFVSCFAQEIAEGMLKQERAVAVDNLSKIIQLGFHYDFKEDAVDFLLTKENLELFMEDEEFLCSTFPSPKKTGIVYLKRAHQELGETGPSTPTASCKRRCK